MNTNPTFAADLKKLMDLFDFLRVEWVKAFGNDQGFSEWFRIKCDREKQRT